MLARSHPPCWMSWNRGWSSNYEDGEMMRCRRGTTNKDACLFHEQSTLTTVCEAIEILRIPTDHIFSRHFTTAILEVPPHTLLDVLNINIFHLCIFCQSGRALQYQPMETIYMILLWVRFFCVFLILSSWIYGNLDDLLCLPGFGARNSQRFTPLYRGNGLFERSHIWTGLTKTCKFFKVWNPQIRGRVWGANLREWF